MANGDDGKFESMNPGFDTHENSFRTEAGPSLVRPLFDLNHKLSDHEGQLKSFSGLVAAVQSSLSSWTTTVLGVGAAILAGFAIVVSIQLYNTQKIDSRTDALGSKIDSGIENISKRTDQIERRIDGLASDVKQLPSAISREMIGVARDISEINRQPPAKR